MKEDKLKQVAISKGLEYATSIFQKLSPTYASLVKTTIIPILYVALTYLSNKELEFNLNTIAILILSVVYFLLDLNSRTLTDSVNRAMEISKMLSETLNTNKPNNVKRSRTVKNKKNTGKTKKGK